MLRDMNTSVYLTGFVSLIDTKFADKARANEGMFVAGGCSPLHAG